ncbi:hypothetical protein [Candidatus Solirubrobacter pratensis]|uniref:hypothetical protein n=1 Tax=Candidatus Solirubrobacter pratensis TaxID=1298857 RepID=UPI0003F6A59B|nr:hypothetical protein [Candidatus Solirubrobacter pratensis]
MTEFDDVIRLLQEGRPQATEIELDTIKQRARRQAADNSRRKQSMKSRLAIVAMVAFGMVFSTAGAGLAVSGITSSSDNASVAQYGTVTPTPTPTATEEGGVLPAEETNNAPKGGTSPAEATPSGGVSPAEATQPTRQIEATTGSQLPFTGFAAIPVMLGGIALLTGGLVLRRRTRAE